MTYRRISIARIGKDPIIDFAAKELAKYLKKAKPDLFVDELCVASLPDTGKKIILRVSDQLAQQLEITNTALDDGYRLEVANDEGVIEGTNARSVLQGVYRFLKEIGFAFTRPGKNGERIPSSLPEAYDVSICEKPSYRHRGVTIEGSNAYQHIAAMIDYLPKCGLNEYYIQFFTPVVFFKRWYGHGGNPYLEAEELDRSMVEGLMKSLEDEIARRGLVYHKIGHGWTCEPFGIEGVSWDSQTEITVSPEVQKLLAEVNGKREIWHGTPLNTNLCYSNPVVRNTLTDAITRYAAENPQIDVIHFWLADAVNNQCECENCRKKEPSDWYVQMLNELDEKMTAAGLKTRIVFLLYFDLLWEPKTEKIKNEDRFILMFAPISRYYGVNYSEAEEFRGALPPYVRNKLSLPKGVGENLARLRKWQEQFHGDSFLFDYHLQWAYLADPGAHFAAKNMFEDMCYLDQMGLHGNVSCQIQRCFFPSGLEFYCLGAGLWNKHQRFDEVEADYYRQVYGEDGPAVCDYLRRISEIFTIYPNYHRKTETYKGEVPAPGELLRPMDLPYVTDPEELRKLIWNFDPVICRGMERQDQACEDWKLLKIHEEYVLRLADIMMATDKKDNVAQEAAIDAFCEYVNKNDLLTQEVLDSDNTVNTYRRHLRGGF